MAYYEATSAHRKRGRLLHEYIKSSTPRGFITAAATRSALDVPATSHCKEEEEEEERADAAGATAMPTPAVDTSTHDYNAPENQPPAPAIKGMVSDIPLAHRLTTGALQAAAAARAKEGQLSC